MILTPRQARSICRLFGHLALLRSRQSLTDRVRSSVPEALRVIPLRTKPSERVAVRPVAKLRLPHLLVRSQEVGPVDVVDALPPRRRHLEATVVAVAGVVVPCALAGVLHNHRLR